MTPTLYFDGLAEPRNPGHGCYGWLVTQNGATLASGKGYIGARKTNNEAEYTALIAGLKAARELGLSEVQVKGDSQLVINQVTGRWGCNAENLRPLLKEAQQLAWGMTVHFAWVPREQNTAADALSQQAYREAQQRRFA